jgi:multidrug efflux pump subunit AcrB
VLMMVLKAGSISTLDIIAGIKQKVLDVKDSLPDALKIGFIGDQSLFVRGAIEGVANEGVIAALLTSVMILLFLGSWRSTVIIATSIPLAVLGAIIMLSLIGETLNIMTLGGLALAVGILVDDATVTIENINYHLEQGKPVEQSILDGANQIVTPAFVSLLCICIVFVPMFFLTGVARFLFVPMAEAVMFAMIWSFLLSRTLVPTMAKYLLKPHLQHAENDGPPPSRNPVVPHPGRHPRRGKRQSIRRRAKGGPQNYPAGGDRNAGRQYRPADQRHQPDLQQHRRDRSAGRRRPDQAQGRPSAYR